MERKERQDRRRAEAGTEQHMERNKTERTDRQMELNERRRSVGLKDEREGKATSPSPSHPPAPHPPTAPCENAVYFPPLQMCCAFIHAQRRDVPGTGGVKELADLGER